MSSNASSYAPDSTSATGRNARVAIPRLQRPHQAQSSAKDRRRVARACTACRNHKIKCSGNNPRCKHCESTSRECIYIMPRKDRLKMSAPTPSPGQGRLLTLAVSLNDAPKWPDISGR